MYISHFVASFSWQSASLPGRVVDSKAVFLLTNSLAFLAASLALAALKVFSNIALDASGFSSKNVASLFETTLLTIPVTSLFPSLVFVCPSNWGSNTLTLTIAVIPSLISSPCKLESFSFKILNFLP